MRASARFPVLKGPLRRQAVRAKQAGHFPLFNCPTLTGHSSNHKDSQMHQSKKLFHRQRTTDFSCRKTICSLQHLLVKTILTELSPGIVFKLPFKVFFLNFMFN